MDYFIYSLTKIQKLFELWDLKIFAGVAFGIMSFFFGHFYTDALVAIMMLMFIDFVLAVAAAKLSGEPVTSRKAGRTLIKGIVYLSAISAGYFADLTIPFDFIQGAMIGFVGVTEFISVLENVGRLGFHTPKKLLNQLKDYQKNGDIPRG